MNKDEFLKEYEKYSLEDLTTIYNDQAELFSQEERDLIFDLIQKKEKPPLPEPAKSMLWLYILSLVFPFGFLAAFILLLQKNKNKYNEKLSVRCGLCAMIGFIAFIIIWCNVN